jgi:hypothetical protein
MKNSSLENNILSTLDYFSQFDYPLTREEVWYWAHYYSGGFNDVYAKLEKLVKIRLLKKRGKFYSITKSSISSPSREQRMGISQTKLIKLNPVINFLQKIPTINAIYVTGSLSMQNANVNDDIDLMVITQANTLWITRIVVVVLLITKKLRRSSSIRDHSSIEVSDKICDNLYLDMKNLRIKKSSSLRRNLYLAHEILQAKSVYDRSDVHAKFIESNSWISALIPNAYKEVSTAASKKKQVLKKSNNVYISIKNLIFSSVNLICMAVQFIYMKPKIGQERIGLGYAFFHPIKYPLDKYMS